MTNHHGGKARSAGSAKVKGREPCVAAQEDIRLYELSALLRSLDSSLAVFAKRLQAEANLRLVDSGWLNAGCVAKLCCSRTLSLELD